jgi:hypothetical protein
MWTGRTRGDSSGDERSLSGPAQTFSFPRSRHVRLQHWYDQSLSCRICVVVAHPSACNRTMTTPSSAPARLISFILVPAIGTADCALLTSDVAVRSTNAEVCIRPRDDSKGDGQPHTCAAEENVQDATDEVRISSDRASLPGRTRNCQAVAAWLPQPVHSLLESSCAPEHFQDCLLGTRARDPRQSKSYHPRMSHSSVCCDFAKYSMRKPCNDG